MPFNRNGALQEIQENLKKVRLLIDDIEEARFNSETTIDDIEKIQEEANQSADESPNKYSRENLIKESALKNVYSKAVKDAKHEEKLLREALEKIHAVREIKNEQRREARKAGVKEPLRRGVLMKMLKDTAKTLPLYIGKAPNSKLPPLCGCIPARPNHIAKEGDLVAAFVQSGKVKDEWILAEILNFNRSKNAYEVEDIDEEDKATYSVPKRNVIPLPEMRANPETDSAALFPIGADVLAVYPQTTCFYKARVYVPPSSPHQDYELLFENEEGEFVVKLSVPQRYVIAFHGKKKSKSQPIVANKSLIED